MIQLRKYVMLFKMKLIKIFKHTTLITLISTNINAAYTASDTFNASIDFVDTITLYVSDLTINNAVGGDQIDKNIPITMSKDSDRSASCSISGNSITMYQADGQDNFTLNSTISGCNSLDISGTLPISSLNGKTYAGSLTVSASYDTITYN